MHEPIIDREAFEQAQELIAKTKRRSLKKQDEEKQLHFFTVTYYFQKSGMRF